MRSRRVPLVLLLGTSLISGAEAPGVLAAGGGAFAQLCRHGSPAALHSAARTRATVLPSFDNDRAMRHIRHLAGGIGVRVRGTRRERRAARYVARKFRSYGYKVYIQKFTVDGGTSRNVVARWPGVTPNPFVIGGHMDTVARSPGANDNASGVAVVLELARLSAARRPARWTKFVAFGSEEYGANGIHHVGSSVFVKRRGADGRRRLPGMISVDMVGRLRGRPLTVGTAGIGPSIVARTLYRKLRKAGIPARYVTSCDCSDNGPFERAGIPAAYAYSGDEPNYHSPRDTVANVSPRSVRRSGRALRVFVAAIDLRMIRRLRRRA